MTTINRSALVPYSAKQMFDLVNDIEHYADFLPWCHSTEVQSRTEEEITAKIDVQAKGVHKSFTTRNALVPGKSMEMNLVDGPFSHFFARWAFQDIGAEGSKVDLHIEFDFNSRLMRMMLGKVFERVTSSMVEAFTERARVLYKEPGND